MMAEVIGAERVVYVKDVDDIYDRDPKSHADAKLVSQATAMDLLDRNYETLPLERGNALKYAAENVVSRERQCRQRACAG